MSPGSQRDVGHYVVGEVDEFNFDALFRELGNENVRPLLVGGAYDADLDVRRLRAREEREGECQNQYERQSLFHDRWPPLNVMRFLC